MNKEILKPLGEYILICSKGDVKQSPILVAPGANETYNNHTQWIDKENTVLSIGEKVDSIKVGDKVLLDPHSPLKKANAITEMFEERLGKKTTQKVKINGKVVEGVDDIEIEKYFLVDIKHILGIIK